MTNKIKINDLVDQYSKMTLYRKFEEKCAQIYGMGLIGGFCHLYIGQEAVISAVDIIRHKNDSIITSYRSHVHAIMCGIDPKYVLAELMGKSTGCAKGKGGSMHMFSNEGKFYGGHGIVGAQVPLGTGIAFAEKYNETKNICFTFLGDGAINQGQVYEAFNMASLWDLPVLYIIENNQYSMGTAVKRSTAMTDLYKKGQAFDIEGVAVNGMRLDEMHDAVSKASEYVRSKSRPFIIEAKTYRYKGHSMSDPAKYRTKDEVEEYRKKQDPIKYVRAMIVESGKYEEEKLNAIDKEIKNKIETMVDFAKNSPIPKSDDLFTDVFA